MYGVASHRSLTKHKDGMHHPRKSNKYIFIFNPSSISTYVHARCRRDPVHGLSGGSPREGGVPLQLISDLILSKVPEVLVPAFGNLV